MLRPPKPLDEIQPNLVCELLTWMGRATANIFSPRPPGALGRGQKVKYHLVSITKSISKIFIPNFVCVLTNERYKTYQTGFSFRRLGHAPGVGFRGAGGAQGFKNILFQTWLCVISNGRRWRAEQNASKIFILGSNWWPWGEVKRSNIIKFQLPCQFQRFLNQTLCVITNERYKTYQMGFSFCRLGHAPEVGLMGAGVPRGSKKNFFKHSHVTYQINGDDKQNRMQVKFSS